MCLASSDIYLVRNVPLCFTHSALSEATFVLDNYQAQLTCLENNFNAPLQNSKYTGWKLKVYHILELNEIIGSYHIHDFLKSKHVLWRFLCDQFGISTLHYSTATACARKARLFSSGTALPAPLLHGELYRVLLC